MVKLLEEWRPIPGYVGYVASSLGRIGSLKGRRETKRQDGIFVLRPFGQDGYARIHLSVGARTRGRFVHQLVALAFHGEPPDGKAYVAHRNGNRADNASVNLRWVSASENIADRRLHNLPRGRDIRRGNVKLPDLLKLAIMRDAAERSLNFSEIARKHGVSHTTVSRLVRGQRKGPEFTVPDGVEGALYEQALREIERLTSAHHQVSALGRARILAAVRAVVLKSLAPEERRGHARKEVAA